MYSRKYKRCCNCCFSDVCDGCHVCDNYSPVEYNEEEELEILIEDGRQAFYEEWIQYIEEWSDWD